jgi:hypothetical protein
MKHSAEYCKFTGLVDRLLSISHGEMERREAEYRKEVDANPNRRGPKRGSKSGKALRLPLPTAGSRNALEGSFPSDYTLRGELGIRQKACDDKLMIS